MPSNPDMRNIGISAHVDSGKTTLTERILFYCDRIHSIHEVRGKDGVGATMDSMELERERGITIASAATHVEWGKNPINIIDTPGHVDFTVEVERSLRVLDGAVLVLCGVAGVQSQSITVDRQMRRYNVPRLAFVNKCDTTGADPIQVCSDLKDKLGLNSAMFQLPIGLGLDLEGLVDLVTMKAYYFDGDNGQDIRIEEIPSSMEADAMVAREELLDTLSMFDDELMEAVLEDAATEEQIHRAARAGIISLELCPVFCGSAYKNKGVQPLLDAVTRYLPAPGDVTNVALDAKTGEEVQMDESADTLAYAFKLEDGQYGQLTYIRVYQGALVKGEQIENARTGKVVKIGRLVRMHSDQMEDIERAEAGDIVALFGIDCASGDTFRAPGVDLLCTSMHVPEPVIQLSIKCVDRKKQANLSKALGRFTREDPTFKVAQDDKTGDTLISGMGELHLEVYIERMKREFGAEVEVGKPTVAYREALTREVKFDYTHKKQTGGSGQFGRIIGKMGPAEGEDLEFTSTVTGGNVPREYIPSVEKGFAQAVVKGLLVGAPIDGLAVELQDGKAHAVDSSDMAFMAAARACFREFYSKGKPQILEPIMKVEISGPSEFQGDMVGLMLARRGILVDTTQQGTDAVIIAETPLAEMFGFSTDLRSATRGMSSYTMELANYKAAPGDIKEELIAEYKADQEAKNK